MPRRNTIYLLAILVLALAVRVAWLDRQSFSMDEVNELVIAHKPVAEVIWVPDRMPPGYSLILKSVLTLFGSDSAGRWLSVAFGVLSIVGVWGVARELVDERVGLAAALITTLLPLHIFYSQYVRVYGFMIFLAAFGIWLLLLALRKQEMRYWAGFTAICLVGVYSHYLFVVFIVISMAVVIAKRRNIWMGRDAVIVCASIALGCVPLYWLLQTDFHLQNSATKVSRLDLSTAAYTYFSFFSGYSLGPSRPELHTIAVSEAIKSAAPWAVAGAICVAILGWEGYQELRGQELRKRRIIPILLTLVIGPVIQVGILSYVTGVSYHLRYVVWCMIPIAIWLGAGLVRRWPTIRVRLAAAGLIAMAGCAIFNHNYVPRYQTEDMRAAVVTLESESAENVPVFVLSDYLAIVVRYYLQSERTVIELPRPGGNRQSVDSESDAADAITAISNDTQESTDFWLVYSRPFHGDPQGLLLKDLSDRKVIKLEHEFAGVQLYRGVNQ